jgi:predicted DNA-binding protein
MATVIERSGVTFTTHDLRRTFATVADSLDIPGYAVKALLNHKTGADVTVGYIIADVERLRGPMQRITDYLLRAGVCENRQRLSVSRQPKEAIMHTVQFDVETEQRLSALAAKGGKQPDALIKEAVLDYLEDLEDYYAAEAASERIKAGEESTLPLEEVMRDLGLDD